MTVLFLTQYFPYLPGEQFLEDEVNHWARQPDVKVVLVPLIKGKVLRHIPSNIELDRTLVGSNVHLKRLRWLLPSLASSYFYQDLLWQLRHGRLSLLNILVTLLATTDLLRYTHDLKGMVEIHSASIVYSYWNTAAAYAAARLKRSGKIKKVVSRMHGFDLYEERTLGGHHSLKRFFVEDFSTIYCLSQSAADYLHKNFGRPKETLVRPLGVQVPAEVRTCPSPGVFHIVSCSFCLPVKRIDKIIKVVALLSRSLPNRDIRWTHIGGGQLFEQMSRQAQETLSALSNLRIQMTGTLSPHEIREFYTTEDISVLLNLSESEGVPVSLLEGMAYAIPAVAPDVGGISSAVIDGVNGRLLSATPSLEEAATALEWLANLPNQDAAHLRNAARETVRSTFNSEMVYPEFIRSVLEV